jgi:hypothetical protein
VPKRRGGQEVVAGLARRFQGEVVVAARAHRVAQVEERQPAGERCDPGTVGEQLASQGRSKVLPKHLADGLQVCDHGRHQHVRRGGVVQPLVAVGQLMQAGDRLGSGLRGRPAGRRHRQARRREADQLEQHAPPHDFVLPGVEHLRLQHGPGGPEPVEQDGGIAEGRDQRVVLGDGGRPLVGRVGSRRALEEPDAVDAVEQREQLAVAPAGALHPALPLRDHVGVHPDALAAADPGEPGELLGDVLLRPPALLAQVPELGGTGRCHPSATPPVRAASIAG